MKRKALIYLISIFSLITSFCMTDAHAIIMELDKRQIDEAIAYGQKRTRVSLTDFSERWTVSLGKNVGWATLYTGYHNLAFKSRKATIEHYELSKQQIKEALEISETITFTVSLLGNSMEFGQEYHASLRHKGKLIPPLFEYAPDYAEPSEFYPEAPDHVAGCVYKFAINDIPTTDVVTLILRPFDGEVLEFDFDLSKMK